MMDQVLPPLVPVEAPKRPAASRLVRALYTHNPFYVISADLVFIGLRMSFDPSSQAFDTWALIASLAGYTLLLATTACLLVRFGRVWDDMRSVLLLVVMMFLAISLTIDDVLILHPRTGLALAVGGLAFALAVSEGLLRGMRLDLPALYRGPYYLILGLFFVYPVALRPLLAQPEAATSHWALFGFATVGGLAFLTLIPAIRRGGQYVKGNGSPWPWPLYPWSLFFFLGLGVCARSYYLCVSLHNVEGYRSIFGLYFLVPFGFAIALLLLEGGLTSRKAGVVRFALLIPPALLVLAMVGHRSDPVYTRFLGLFQEGLGVAPPMATLILAFGYYAYAAYRSVPMAQGLALVSLLALGVVGPSTLGPRSLIAPPAWPVALIGLVQGWLAIRRRESWRALLAATCLVASVALLPSDWGTADQRIAAAVHLAVFALMALGLLPDGVGEACRGLAAWGLLLVPAAVMVGEPHLNDGIPARLLAVYPALVAVVAATYAAIGGGWFFGAIAGVIGAIGGVHYGSKGYLLLRQHVAGLDRISVGLASFLIATAISLWKAGLPQRWLAARSPVPRADRPPSAVGPGG